MSIWAAFLRFVLVVAVVVGSAPQMAMASDQASSAHAAMMSMSQADMASETDKPRVDTCERHCLAVAAVLPAMPAPVFEARPLAKAKPHFDVLRVSRAIAPTGPPPKGAAG